MLLRMLLLRSLYDNKMNMMTKWRLTASQISEMLLEQYPAVMDVFNADVRIVGVELSSRMSPYDLRNLSRHIDVYNLCTMSSDTVQLEAD